MSAATTVIEFHASHSPPPAGPTAVDPTAPPLTSRALGIEGTLAEREAPAQRPTEPTKPEPESSAFGEPAARSEGGTRPFSADIDACEIDDRGRPETIWSAKARELGRGSLVFVSRRMCYPGRRLVLLIHRIDSEPTPLHGLVQACDYDADGLYSVELRLLPMPGDSQLRAWVDMIMSRR